MKKLIASVLLAVGFASASVAMPSVVAPPEPQRYGLPTSQQMIEELKKNNLILIWTNAGLMIVWSGGVVTVPWSEILQKFKTATSLRPQAL